MLKNIRECTYNNQNTGGTFHAAILSVHFFYVLKRVLESSITCNCLYICTYSLIKVFNVSEFGLTRKEHHFCTQNIDPTGVVSWIYVS